MGARGPSKKSPALKELDNPSKREFGGLGDLTVLTELPSAPERLGDDGKAIWQKAGQRLVALKMLSDADLAAFELYCASWDEYITATNDIAKNGYSGWTEKGYEYVRPSVARRAAAEKSLKDWGRKFGLTPQDRPNVELPVRAEVKESDDPFEDDLPQKPTAEPPAPEQKPKSRSTPRKPAAKASKSRSKPKK